MGQSAKTYLRRFFEEKDIDREERFTVEGPEWGENSIPYGCVIEAIMQAPAAEQEQIANMLRRIDFKNGDVRDYLRHLGKALAK
jgi:hypothetical protein